MPFKSEKQRRFLWAEHPDIAHRWAHEKRKSRRSKKRKMSRRKTNRRSTLAARIG